MAWNRKKLKQPREIPKMNHIKIQEDMIQWINKVIDKMIHIAKRTDYIDLLYKFKHIVRPPFHIIESIDYGILPYDPLKKVNNKRPMECLFQTLSHVFMYWWDYLLGQDKKLDLCKITLTNLENLIDNRQDYEMKYTEKLGWKLVKKS